MSTEGPARILVVDDDDDLRRIVCKELSAYGFRVDQANDGEEAIAKLQAEPVELITLDIKLPNVDGWGVLNFVKENHLTTRVVMLTAYGSVQSATRAQKMGADAFLEKPYDMDELLFTIEGLLDNGGEALGRTSTP